MEPKDKQKDQPGVGESPNRSGEASGGQPPVIKSSAMTTEASSSAASGQDGDQIQLVLTLNGSTGELVQVEKLTDPATGKREPLNEEEWAQLLGVDMSGATDFSEAYASSYDPSMVAAYYYAMDPSGYAAAYGDPYAAEEYTYSGSGASLAEQLVAAGYDSTDAAYYQGIADFVAYSGQ